VSAQVAALSATAMRVAAIPLFSLSLSLSRDALPGAVVIFRDRLSNGTCTRRTPTLRCRWIFTRREILKFVGGKQAQRRFLSRKVRDRAGEIPLRSTLRG